MCRRTQQLMIFVLAGFIVSCGQDREAKHYNSDKAKALSSEQIQMIDVNADSLLKIIREIDANVKVVNVWATWCQPCREEFPDLLRAYEKTRDR